VKQTLTISELALSLNKWQRTHWGKRAKEKEKWIYLIKEQKPKKHAEAVDIVYTRVSTRMIDLDNLGGSFKCIGDALVKCKVIQDDNPLIVRSLTLRWEKAKSIKEQCSIINLTDADKIEV
jgi:hypothetical protein